MKTYYEHKREDLSKDIEELVRNTLEHLNEVWIDALFDEQGLQIYISHPEVGNVSLGQDERLLNLVKKAVEDGWEQEAMAAAISEARQVLLLLESEWRTYCPATPIP